MDKEFKTYLENTNKQIDVIKSTLEEAKVEECHCRKCGIQLRYEGESESLCKDCA